MSFTQLIEAAGAGQDFTVPADWAQGRACFGGLAAALVFARMRTLASARPVRSLSLNFVGPLESDKPVELRARVLREGRAVTHLHAEALQDDQVVLSMLGSFGLARSSQLQVEAVPAPLLKSVEQCQELPYLPKVTPEFIRHLAMRWAEGGLPFSGNRARAMAGWVRFRDERPEQLNEAHLLALVDAWPPVLLSHLRGPATSSSLTWTIEFIQPLPELSGDQWCQYRAEIEHASAGYGHIAAQFWCPQGRLLAISRQTVTVFA